MTLGAVGSRCVPAWLFTIIAFSPKSKLIQDGSAQGAGESVGVGGALWATWSSQAVVGAAGTVSRIKIPGPLSGFDSRTAEVYLPPAAAANAPASSVVMVMLDQADAPNLSALAKSLDILAGRLAGLAPIAVAIDQVGCPERIQHVWIRNSMAKQKRLWCRMPPAGENPLHVSPYPSQ